MTLHLTFLRRAPLIRIGEAETGQAMPILLGFCVSSLQGLRLDTICCFQKLQEAGTFVLQQLSAYLEMSPVLTSLQAPTSLPLMLCNCRGLLSAASGRCVTLPGALPRP